MTEEQTVQRRGREGGRWINERPTSEEFGRWFAESMKLDAALRHEDYVGGVVLIPGVDSKVPYVTGFTDSGVPIIERREELIFTPYAKVETRTAYYWDLLDVHPDWVGVVEHETPGRMPIDFITEEEHRQDGEGKSSEIKRRQPGALSVLTHQLPEGFSMTSVPAREGYTHFICCTIRVSIFKANENHEPVGFPLRTGRGTKQVPLLTGYQNNPYADPSSLMKAETGAFGRALGFAGIFVIPGSGVATAEDMLEALAQGQPVAEAAPATGNQGPAAPVSAPMRSGAERAQDEEAELRARASALYKTLSEDHPEKAEEFGNWAKSRHFHSLTDAKGGALRGVVRKLEKLTDEGGESPQAAPADEPTPEETGDAQPSGETE